MQDKKLQYLHILRKKVLNANASLMGTSGDLIGKIISTKIFLSLMGSPGHIDGLEEKNHASRVGHFSPSYMSLYSCPMDSLVPLPDPFLNCFLLHNFIFLPHPLSLCTSLWNASACISVKLIQI